MPTHLESSIARAEACFADHIIAEAPGGSPPFAWRLTRPEGGICGSVNIVAIGNRLIVFGDACELVSFGNYSRHIGSLDVAAGAISWIGSSRSWEYLREKASIGSGWDLCVNDRGQAERDIRLFIEDAEEQGLDVDTLQVALEFALDENFADARCQVSRSGDDGWEIAGDIGRIGARRLYQGWAAIARLHVLLEKGSD